VGLDGVGFVASEGCLSSLSAGVGAAAEDEEGVALPFEGVFGVIVSIGTTMLGAAVDVTLDEQGVLLA
jgi:hypothetical protein